MATSLYDHALELARELRGNGADNDEVYTAVFDEVLKLTTPELADEYAQLAEEETDPDADVEEV